MSKYRGRFAPSPTGRLHFGSLLAALASYVDARQAGGAWLVRIEDIDESRTVAGASDDQLRLLEAYGFHWDDSPWVQSTRKQRYSDLAGLLEARGQAYPCACSRAEVRAAAQRQGADGPVYAGTCRNGLAPDRVARSFRVVVDDTPITTVDRIAGPLRQRLSVDVGDFVIRRADGFHAYQLACVVDDADQGITHVVRGADLLSSTPRQMHLQRLLDFPTPAYGHIPLVLDERGRKLSKQSRAAPVRPDNALATLVAAWRFLGQQPVPPDLGGLAEFWPWAIDNWRIGNVPQRQAQPPVLEPEPGAT